MGVLTPMENFFTNNIIGVFFFYGLAFFSMGLAVLLEISHSSELDFARALKPLAGFGLVHGSHEWFEMGLLIHNRLTGKVEADWVFYLRLFLLGISFLFLVAFGANLILGMQKAQIRTVMLLVIAVLWGVGLLFVLNDPAPNRNQLIAADVYTRYSLAIPGAVLTTWGLLLQRRRFIEAGMGSFGWDVAGAAVAFALYGGVGQLFASTSTIFPSPYINSELFLSWFGIPIQVFRAVMAVFAAIFIIRSLRAFNEENRRLIQELTDAQKMEQQRLRELQSELLRRTVQAQELERKRIARELHDETGQTLTALGLGLSSLSQIISRKPSQAIQQAHQLQQLAGNGLVELQRLVSGLHPPQLDELGLAAALRWYAHETSEHLNLPITVNSSVDETEISDEVRLTIFRIAQEAITNAVRHAHASRVKLNLESQGMETILTVQDDGRGFNVDQMLHGSEQNCLGLLGMIERAALIGGGCQIRSSAGEGTIVEVRVNRAHKNEN
jgi:signal transduction histidine kinase